MKLNESIVIDIEGLVKMAESEKDLAMKIFDHYYSKKMFKVLDGQIQNNNKTLRFDTVQKMFEYFGHFISKLVVEFVDEGLYHGRATELGESVNAYCAESLTQFELLQTGKGYYFFQLMTKPFTRVEYVTVTGQLSTLKSETLSFDELFPAVKKMNLFNLGKIIDTNSINSEFQHLEYAALWIRKQFGNLVTSFTDVDVENFLRKNTQLHGFKLEFVDREILKLALRLLTKLKYLEINGSSGKMQVDDFNNLAPEEMNLDELSMPLSESVNEKMITTFVSKSEKIKKLHFEITTTSKSLFHQLVDNMKNTFKQKWTFTSTTRELYPNCFRSHLYLQQVTTQPTILF